ncbi:MAG: dephospho-CoA kinase [Gammaproteobacteria bacterium]|nr:dephospho-CoA kinase [Gammaproteobacteria bacterium]
MIIGLTGGIASGKTTVARLFAACDIDVIDSDRIAREVVAPGQPALEQVVRMFGSSILGKDGQLDRKQLRNIVFSDESKRRELEALLHPLIRSELLRQADASDTTYQVLEVPLLVEGGLHEQVDRVLVVDCNEDTQRQRLRDRDGVSATQAAAALAAQTNRKTRLAVADDVIVNDSVVTVLPGAVDELDHCYRLLSA